VVAGDVAAQLRLAHHRGEEPVSDPGSEQPVTILREGGRIEGLGVDRQIEEPLEQQVVVQALAEGPLAAHRVQRHQDRRLQQLFGRDAGPADPRVHRLKVAVEPDENLVDDLADPADRMILRDQILGAQRHEHRQLLLRLASHARGLPHPATHREHLHDVLQHPAKGLDPPAPPVQRSAART
jgi:hypothetical protein